MEDICLRALKRAIVLMDRIREQLDQPDFQEWSTSEMKELQALAESIKHRCPELAELVESIRQLVIKLQSH